jgi:hypothetical protein
MLPVALGALLVAAAMIGSNISFKFRRRLERFVSYPLLMGILGGETVWALWTHDTVRAMAFGVPCVLYGALRKPLIEKPARVDASQDRPKRSLVIGPREERPVFDRRVG